MREQTDNISALMIQQQCEKADSALPPYTESLKPVSEEEIDILTKNSISEVCYYVHRLITNHIYYTPLNRKTIEIA